MSVVGNWLKRVRISMRGFALWVKVGYPFILLFLAVLISALMRGANWLHIWIILTLGATLTIAEMLNYAIEKLCDVVKPQNDGRIRDIKDLCSGAVLVAGLALGIVGLWVILG